MADDQDSKQQQQSTPEPVAGHLVTVESQSEFDLFTGQRAERTFLKLYVAARTSGLLATISDRDWKTLCTLATYMDADGYCFPSQAELARALGCSRQMANERVKKLAQFRFQDKPVLLIEKETRSEQGRWSRNGYRVLPIASLSIFDQEADRTATDGRKSNRPKRVSSGKQALEQTVSRLLDTVEKGPTVSSATVTVGLDTNKNQVINKNQISLSNIRKAQPEKSEEERGIEQRMFPRAGVDPTPAQGRTRSPELVGETLSKRLIVSQPEIADEERDIILNYMHDFSREFHDRAPLTSTTTRALNLYHRSGLTLETYIGYLYRARSITKERSGSIRGGGGQHSDTNPAKNKTAYFFAVLEDQLGFKESEDSTTKNHDKT